ncbi:hypothetical protein FDP41_009045 [Naegleria fowleri]|uniref:Uncharacterized protein n=1 Tax=Naegleria fowleri TaxID=5763 RepID=A0A6A5BDU4_NAEFO|nr:uncharacterized protein FDP41_009045 [Naegleria fowleri]KAF0972796.1 hypothetical protein FDP41_009045 [Naegleria fowleri]CAG4719571.1 unnamed protein product [Naegleria fowleri]
MSSSEKSPYFAYSFKNRGGRDALSIHYYLHRSRLENSKSVIDNKTPRTMIARPKKRNQHLNGDMTESRADSSYNFTSPSLSGFLNSPRSAANSPSSPTKSRASSSRSRGPRSQSALSHQSLRQRCMTSMSEELRNSSPLSFSEIQEIEELSTHISNQLEQQNASERRAQYDQYVINTPRERFLEDKNDLEIYNKFAAMVSKFSNSEIEEILEGVRKHVHDYKLLREFGGDPYENY